MLEGIDLRQNIAPIALDIGDDRSINAGPSLTKPPPDWSISGPERSSCSQGLAVVTALPPSIQGGLPMESDREARDRARQQDSGRAARQNRRAQKTASPARGPMAPSKAKSKFAKPTVDPNSKIGALVSLLRKRSGTTVTEMAKATGWQPHSVRGALSGTIKKKLGLKVQSSKSGEVRVYRIAG